MKPLRLAILKTKTIYLLVCDQKNHYYFTGPPSGRAYGIFDPGTCCNLCLDSEKCLAYSYFGYNQTCLLYDYPGLYIARCLPELQCLYSNLGRGIN
jgi:hypothetical protein